MVLNICHNSQSYQPLIKSGKKNRQYAINKIHFIRENSIKNVYLFARLLIGSQLTTSQIAYTHTGLGIMGYNVSKHWRFIAQQDVTAKVKLYNSFIDLNDSF